MEQQQHTPIVDQWVPSKAKKQQKFLLILMFHLFRQAATFMLCHILVMSTPLTTPTICTPAMASATPTAIHLCGGVVTCGLRTFSLTKHMLETRAHPPAHTHVHCMLLTLCLKRYFYFSFSPRNHSDRSFYTLTATFTALWVHILMQAYVMV